MSRVSSLVIERVAAEVAFFTTRPVAEVDDLVFLPVTLFETHVPRMVASVPVMVIYPFVQRFFVSGVTIGAIKG